MCCMQEHHLAARQDISRMCRQSYPASVFCTTVLTSAGFLLQNMFVSISALRMQIMQICCRIWRKLLPLLATHRVVVAVYLCTVQQEFQGVPRQAIICSLLCWLACKSMVRGKIVCGCSCLPADKQHTSGPVVSHGVSNSDRYGGYANRILRSIYLPFQFC